MHIIGHRGLAGYAPENTLEGIRSAADMGLDWVECDVKLTRDGVPVLFHDETLERTTNGTGRIADMDYADLRELDAGSWFSEGFTGACVPSLEEALEVLLACDLSFHMEIKPCPGREKETAEIALDVASRFWDSPERIVISSFQPVCLECAADMIPEWPRALLLESVWPENWQDLAAYLGVKNLHINGQTATHEQITMAKAQGYNLIAYTVNDPKTMQRLQNYGVAAVFSDEPDKVM